MAKKTPPSVGDPGNEAPDPDKRSPVEREQERQEQQLVDLIHRTKLDDGIVALRRRAVNEVEFGHLGEMSASAFTEENVRKIYGGGDYKLQFKTAAGKFVGSASLKIDYSIPAKYPGAATRQEERASDRGPELIQAVTAAIKNNTPPPPPPQDNSLVIELMKQNAAITQAALSRPQQPAVDPTLAAMLAEMRAEQREVRAALLEMKTSRGSGGDGLREIEKFLKLQELLGTGGGGGDSAPEAKPDRITAIITALAPAFAPAIARMMQNGSDPNAGLPMQPMVALPEGQAVAPAGTAINPAPTSTPQDEMNVFIKMYLAEFRRLATTAASKGRDAYEWADTKLDDIKAEYHPKIFEMANAEDWFAQFFGGDAAAQVHFKWLFDMRNAILTRHFIAQVEQAAKATPPPTPEVFCKRILDTMSVSWADEALWNMTDAATWGDRFAPSRIEASAWLEHVRAAFEKELGGEEEDPEETPPNPGKERATEKPAATPKPARAAARKK